MIDTLTSLRFVFALMVFGAHCYVIDPFFGAHFFKEGFVGVSFFFVLSGFIIAYNYEDKLSKQTTARRTFWVARFARIYPLHLLTLFLAALLGGYVAANGTLDWWKHFFASLLLLQAYVPKADYYFSFNSPSWSLCCEQLFYFLFPFLALWAHRGRKLVYLFLVCAVLVVVGMYFTPVEKIKGYWYVNPLTRLPDFIWGMLLYKGYIRLKNLSITRWQGTVAEILAVAVFILFCWGAAEVPKVYRYSCYYWLPVAFILLSFALQKGALSQLLSFKWLIIGGEISYGFYLIHLFVILTYKQCEEFYRWQLSWPVVVPLLFVLTVMLSLLSYYYFEKPMNKQIKKRFANGKANQEAVAVEG